MDEEPSSAGRFLGERSVFASHSERSKKNPDSQNRRIGHPAINMTVSNPPAPFIFPARPSNPYFLPVAAHYLTKLFRHAILSRVCQTKLPSIHFPRFRRPAPTSLASLGRISHHCKSFVCHSYENNRGVYQLFPFWNSPLHSAIPRPDFVGGTSHLAT